MAQFLDNLFQQHYRRLPIAIHASTKPARETAALAIHKHYHKEFEVIGVVSGACDFTIDQKEWHAKKGDVLLIPPYSLHYGSTPPKEHFEHFCICFDLCLLQTDFFDRQFEAGTIDIVRLLEHGNPDTEIFYRIAHHIFRQCQTMPASWELVVEGGLLAFFGLLQQKNYIFSNVRDSAQDDFGQNVLHYLSQHYCQNITSRDLAAWLSYSQGYFCRKFHATFDRPFQQYLCQYRLSKARLLLAQDGISIEETARKVGFNHTGYFVRQFHATYGCTPKQFQKSQTKGNVFQPYQPGD